MNRVCLIGRLTADPEIRTTTSGNEVTTFCIAVDRPFSKDKNARSADFFNIVAWDNNARFVCNYFTKGQQIAIDGQLSSRRYQDQGGNNRTAVEVVAREVSFCGGKPQKKESTTEGGVYETGFATASASDFDEVGNEDDLPF